MENFNSKMIKGGIHLSPEAKEEIEINIKAWLPKDIKQTSDHFGEGITTELKSLGIELPKGGFNNNMHKALLNLSKEFHLENIPLELAVEKGVAIAMNPKNYGTVN
jgi:hypothetical protein